MGLKVGDSVGLRVGSLSACVEILCVEIIPNRLHWRVQKMLNASTNGSNIFIKKRAHRNNIFHHNNKNHNIPCHF